MAGCQHVGFYDLSTPLSMTIEYVTLGIYLVLLLVLGFSFSKDNRNVSDFVRGGAQGTWWLVGSSILIAGISAFTFTGNASAAYDAGPTFLVIYAANVVGYLAGALFLGRWMRQTRAFTLADILRERFGPEVEQFQVYLGVFLYPFASAIQLWALAVFVSSLFGFPLVGTIIVIGAIVVFYSASGGKWAVMATDFVQGLIVFAITLVVAFLSLREIGGFGAFFDYFSDPRFADDFKFVKEPGEFPDDKFSWKWIIVIFIMQVYQQISFNQAGRYLTCKDGREASRASWLAMVLMFVGTAVWFIPPMVARFMYSDQVAAAGVAASLDDPATASYAVIARELLPQGALGILIAAMFAATMSSMDSGINGVAGQVVRNMLPPLRRRFRMPELTSEQGVRAGRWATFILGALIISQSLVLSQMGKIKLFDAYLLINSVIGIPLAFPMMISLYLRRIPRWSFFVIFAAGLMPSIYSVIDARLFDNPWSIQQRAAWVFIFSLAATLATIPFFKNASQEYKDRLKAFFERMHTPVDFKDEVGVSKDARQGMLVSRAAFVMGGAMLLLIFFPEDWAGRFIILFIGGFVIAAGALLRFAAIRERRRAERAMAEANNQ